MGGEIVGIYWILIILFFKNNKLFVASSLSPGTIYYFGINKLIPVAQ